MLVLRQDGPGAVTSTVLRDRLPVPGDEATGASGTARGRLHSVVTGLASGTGRANPLARFGVRYVLVPHPDGVPLVRTLDAVPDLARLSRTREFALWEVTAPAGRLLLVDRNTVTPLPTGQIDARVTIPPGASGRTLLLAEPADGGWRATLDGVAPRSRTVDGWAQAYDMPSTGGVFTLRRGMRLRHLWVAAQALALVVVVLLALPSSRWETHRPRGRRRRAKAAIAAPKKSEASALTVGAHRALPRARRRGSDVDEPSEAGT
jgi:BarA-like signal transduction histidine kinase